MWIAIAIIRSRVGREKGPNSEKDGPEDLVAAWLQRRSGLGIRPTHVISEKDSSSIVLKNDRVEFAPAERFVKIVKQLPVRP